MTLKREQLTNMNIIVMAGGSGTRFWPESTLSHPKQYLKLGGDKTLLQKTLERFEGVVPQENLFVVTLKSQKESALTHSGGLLSEKSLILEPFARNTAPCILLSLAKLLHQGSREEDLVSFFAADHMIQNNQEFQRIVRKSAEFVQKNPYIVTLGIMPTFPNTGFGYIAAGKNLDGEFCSVEGFKEKPNLETAKEYLLQGRYYWNAGMFISSIKTLCEEFALHAPDHYKAFQAMQLALRNGQQEKLESIYQSIVGNSIDYAVMEKSRKVAVIKAQIGWNDIGSWDALSEIMALKEKNTFLRANDKIFCQNAQNNIVCTDSGKVVALIDVSDFIIIENSHALMVMPKTSAQKVKDVVEFLKKQDYGKEYL